MKIAKAETILLSIPFESGGVPPWSFGGKARLAFDILLIRLETDTGLVGWGEAFSRNEDVALKQLIEAEQRLRDNGITLWLAAMNAETRAIVERSGLWESLGRERLFFNLESAVLKYQGLEASPPAAASA